MNSVETAVNNDAIAAESMPISVEVNPSSAETVEVRVRKAADTAIASTGAETPTSKALNWEKVQASMAVHSED